MPEPVPPLAEAVALVPDVPDVPEVLGVLELPLPLRADPIIAFVSMYEPAVLALDEAPDPLALDVALPPL
jgi:hypothetical protein